MFDCDTDPDDLQRCLEGFIQRWHGSHSFSWGISAAKLEQHRCGATIPIRFQMRTDQQDN